MRITINGQLSLAMLYEMITERIPGAIPLMQNTDGLETAIPRKYKDQYMEICAEWEMITKLQLEHDTYSKIILGDVNNYIAVNTPYAVDYDTMLGIRKDNPHYHIKRLSVNNYEVSPVKCKGRFEFHDLALHKNKSFLVISKAIFNYFVNNIDPKDYLKQQTNIFDFCGGKKIKGDWEFIEHYVNENGDYIKKPLQKTIRYYVSNTGSKIIKHNYTDERDTQIEAGKWLQTLYVDHTEKDISKYDLNYDYYLEKVMKEINNLKPNINQYSIF
jgi:hypothetical protein